MLVWLVEALPVIYIRENECELFILFCDDFPLVYI
jgi:hypothetical protein